jgi:hypothetical protein
MGTDQKGTFTVGLAGAFLGALLTLGVNWLGEHFKQEEEKKHVTKALLVEVYNLKNAVVSQRDWWADEKLVDPEKKLRPLIPFSTDAYDHFSGKLDLLDPEIAQAIIDFYGRIKFINEYQKIEHAYETPEERREFYCGYDHAIGKHFSERFGTPQQSNFAEFYRRFGLDLKEQLPRRLIADDLKTCMERGLN